MGYVRWATFGFIAFLTIVFLVTPYAGNFSEFIVFAAAPMLLAGMFYSFKWTTGLVIIIDVTVFVLNSLYNDETIWERRILWYFLLFAGALVLAFKYHLNQLETIRRQRVDEANAHLQALLDALPDMLFELDRSGHLLDYHVPVGAELDIPLENYRGKAVSEILPAETAQNIMLAIAAAAETGRHTGTIFSLELLGERRWFEVSIAAGWSDHSHAESQLLVAVARDITERKQAELLRTQQTTLEIALEKEKELAQLRSQLISTIAHEFRTPLTVILFSSSLLVKYGDRLSPERHSETVENIVMQVKRLDEMLDDVSTLSKTRRGFLQFQPQPVDIAAFCAQLVEELESIKQPNQVLVLNVMDHFANPVQLDEVLLRHTLTNLISNAIKYSPDGGVVTLELCQSDGNIVLTVNDQGIGIPPGDMDRLFQPFYRAANVSNIHGTGLGLSIAREAVALHGGTITCKSQLNKGTTFKVIIPMKEGAVYD
jgi:PAS domain S-box-containing protein